MKWKKKGLIYNANKEHEKMYSYAQIPVPFKLEDSLYRIYFSSRSNAGKTYPYFLDFDFKNNEIEYIEKKPLLEHGEIGTFDDSGIMPSSIIEHNNLLYMYYIAWNPQKTVSYRLSIGLAISKDGGVTFEKFSKGPILDRSLDEPFFNTAPFVIKEDNIFKMWYVSCTGWKVVNKKTEPLYLIRYAESKDGIYWKKINKPVIPYKFEGEAIGRPWVMKDDGIYKMWYSTRGSINYRNKDGEHYMIGYAESNDGISWIRKDDEVGIDLSNKGWDSEMLEYCSVIKRNNQKIMLYNGNSFGLTGFGYAEL
ncbi:hypothetical protein [Orenia marismortui]|uniref:Glycosyl hydrolase family 32 n=1 Tax=Orenia marismortui TaxID=46469 RepID=A0A4R8HFP9_9FIRM|nr:hypothetical protein [Orenia marismortui]TDX58920.1 hypothetical protein C7959_10258 [Orenia marismortui]